jgi:FeS assembly SUF system protein
MTDETKTSKIMDDVHAPIEGNSHPAEDVPSLMPQLPESVEKTAEGIESAGKEADGPADEDGFPPIPEAELDRIRDDIIAALKTVYDPEIPVDIYELGLIYTVDIKNDYSAHVEMTLTSPGCPVAGEMPEWVVNAVVGVEGIRKAKVTLTFDPPWDMSMMSEEARFALNMF